MFSEDDLLPISALQHVVFCDRQAALIHVERLWTENVHTVEGHHLHQLAHETGAETRGELRIVRGLAIRSLRLGVAGIADVVEFRRMSEGPKVQDYDGLWQPFPIEYKKGKPKRHRADEVQLCAQAICLEEMFSVIVAEGALYYGKTKRRKTIRLDEELRRLTADAAARFREIVETRLTPPARYGPKCRECSLILDCRPRAAEKSARRYLSAILGHAAEIT